MKRVSIICFALLVLITCTCQAASLTGAKNYGITADASVFEIQTGTTLDYELTSDFFLTLDIQTRYSRVSQPLSRYELSANWYPDWLFLRGYCLSIGTAVRTEKAPMWFLEVSTPWTLNVPRWLRFWEWWGKE